jgi:TatD DNase family protein
LVLIDTHTHIYSSDFAADQAEMMQRAIDAGVKTMLLPAIDTRSFDAMWQTVANFPKRVKPMIGLHPCSVKEDFETELALVQRELENNLVKYVAVGEIGIDLFWDKSTFEMQEEAFRCQLHWAKQYKLPVAIHARNSFDEIFTVLEQEKTDDLRGVLHCFTGGKRHVIKARELGFYMGIGGVVTYAGSGVDHVLKRIELSEMLLETDAPYLAPNPHKSERNEPAFLPYIAKAIAEIKGVSVEEVVEITSANAKKLFKL